MEKEFKAADKELDRLVRMIRDSADIDLIQDQVEDFQEVWCDLESALMVGGNLTDDPDMDDLLRKCIETQRKKGADYTIGTGDKLHNFRTVAGMLDLSMEKTWSVYFYKHVSAIFAYCKKGQVESEPIEGRIMDCIVYLLLLHKMTKEREREVKMRAALDGTLSPVPSLMDSK